MSEFTIRSESVDVEQIMKQIRQRVLEKRGADYTEDQIRELATVRLEKFLDPKNLRSDLLEQFRKSRPSFAADTHPSKTQAPYTFDDQTLFASHRGFIRFARKLLNPFLKLLFNSNTLNQVLHTQSKFNVELLKRDLHRKIERSEWNALYYEVLHNLVLETTRMGIEVQNLRMKVESLSSRLDFSERRVRALEGVVQYRPEAVRGPDRSDEDDHVAPQAAPAGSIEGFVPAGGGQASQGDGSGRKRRRRRRGRRGQGASGGFGAPGTQGAQGAQGVQGAQGAQGEDAGPEDTETYEAGENGADDGDEFENGEEISASGGFDVPEPIEEPTAAPAAPEAPEASAFAPKESEELRRDKPQAPDLPDVPVIPETLKTPEPGDDDLQ
jgi:hypothetical protein